MIFDINTTIRVFRQILKKVTDEVILKATNQANLQKLRLNE